MDGLLVLAEHVPVHLVAADAEDLGVGELHGPVEAAPEDDPGGEKNEPADRNAEHQAGPWDAPE